MQKYRDSTVIDKNKSRVDIDDRDRLHESNKHVRVVYIERSIQKDKIRYIEDIK